MIDSSDCVRLILFPLNRDIPSIGIPKGSMYGIFTYIWLIFMVNVGKYTIHGSSGIGWFVFDSPKIGNFS